MERRAGTYSGSPLLYPSGCLRAGLMGSGDDAVRCTVRPSSRIEMSTTSARRRSIAVSSVQHARDRSGRRRSSHLNECRRCDAARSVHYCSPLMGRCSRSAREYVCACVMFVSCASPHPMTKNQKGASRTRPLIAYRGFGIGTQPRSRHHG